uniref:Uncharacterized protein n=1 Tax=Siphoviridae sp. ctHip2 TaxID=2827830 RepID=A0A8S5RWC0_9CAUD|nr:MAG TPA: hypothetical protein [Siphoviridae sp. ctHip2]
MYYYITFFNFYQLKIFMIEKLTFLLYNITIFMNMK